ncbi:hypothetical protein PPECC33_02167 [Escherichia coli PCN033]|nr:hypothetical protein PPECC33_02167 [Escherichia coli PCN033]
MRENQQSCKDFRQQIVCKCNKLLIETANSWEISKSGLTKDFSPLRCASTAIPL